MTEQQNNKLLLGHCLNIVWNSVKISGNVIDFTDTELTAESLSHFRDLIEISLGSKISCCQRLLPGPFL